MTWFNRPPDRGSVSLTTVICAPGFFLLLGLVIAFGRVDLATGSADAAARAAARTASLSRDPILGEQEARTAALTSLRESGLKCSNVDVAVDTSGLSAPLGEAATVSATVTCTARLDDIALPGLVGHKNLTSTMTSVVDTWRSRAGGAS
ncbi:pilus assembly protein [Streptomyces sp. NBC_01381]|uniref:pilus assembly protein n=1 Tax=Streptomyces sp. NBC_01381 TaxID=2903845 RepID=UPI0022562ADE|nr:pilus assembly protein [Streptomyces sp. NBC_01381]MCX4673642.1 pilus assembly protein [Streptomyces sp. NBC_01381]